MISIRNQPTTTVSLPLMKTPHHQCTGLLRRSFLTLAALGLLTVAASAQVPAMISYQGRVLMNNTNFGGNGQFKFALTRAAGPTLLWKNDGSAGNTEPAAAVTLPVANGLVMTTLGDTTLANMTALPSIAFEYPDVRLRVWFNGGAGFQQLSPDQRIVSVGYALMAGNVPDASLTLNKLAPGVFSPTNFPANSVTSVQLGDDLDLGSTSTVGRLDVFRTAANTPAITLDGAASSISTFGSDGLEQIRLHGTSWGELLLRNSLPNNATAVNLTAQGSTGGRLSLNNTNGTGRAILEGENTGGLLTLYTADGNAGAILYGNEGAGSGALSLRNTNGNARFRAYGGPLDGSLELYSELGRLTFAAEGGEGNTGSQLNMYQSNGVRTLQFDAENGVNGGGYAAVYSGDGGAATISSADSQGGQFAVYEEDGSLTTLLHNISNAGIVSVRNGSGTETGYLWGNDIGNSGGGMLALNEADGTETVAVTANGAGNIVLRQADGSQGFGISANNGTGGGGLAIYRDNGTFAGQMTVASSAGFLGLANSAGVNKFVAVGATAAGGAALYLTDSTGATTITLDSDQGNEGRITTQVLTITGGSDLSENFEINAAKDELQAGMIVSIDPKNPGELVLAREAYDNKVAGIVSGAGGVKTGMLMSQAGTKADGKHPVALTGRVYCQVDASYGAIQPGDMITTSSTPGHGMKATDRERAFGSIIGKAMTGLTEGKGLVLVLVSLQ